jgi:hypothetical protein
MKLALSVLIFEKFSKDNFMKIRPVTAGLFHADGRTDMTRIIVIFFTFFLKHINPTPWEWRKIFTGTPKNLL